MGLAVGQVRNVKKNYSSDKKQARPSPKAWVPDGKEILRKIREDSVERRSNPLEYFKKFLGAYWIDQSEEEVFDHWQAEIREGSRNIPNR
jgi:hypothetical protein